MEYIYIYIYIINIQTWFELLKREHIDLGFARAAAIDDENDVVGELIGSLILMRVKS